MLNSFHTFTPKPLTSHYANQHAVNFGDKLEFSKKVTPRRINDWAETYNSNANKK